MQKKSKPSKKKSTKPMPYTALEVQEIIACCQRSGVGEFCLGDLKLVFGRPPEEPTKVVAVELPASLAQESLKKSELETKEDQLAMMLIEDPLGYEKLVLSGELEDEEAHTR